MSIDDTPNDLVTRLEADARQLDLETRPITIADIELRRMTTTPWSAPTHVPRARTAAALIMAAVLSIAAIVAWNASRSTKDSARRIQVTSPSTDAATPSASESVHAEPLRGSYLYLEPTYVPAGFTIVSAQGPGLGGANKAGSPEVKASQSWVKFDAARDAVDATLGIQWGPGVPADPPQNGRPVITDPLDGWRNGSVAVTVRGRNGLYSSRIGGVAWEEPPGQAASVDCVKCSRDELVQIANKLVLRADGGFTWPAPHDGFEFVNEAPGMQSLGTNVRQLTYRGPNGAGFMIVIADDTDEPPFSQLAMPNVQIVKLRNTHGIIGPQINVPGSGTADTAFMLLPTLSVQWLEYPNVAVTVVGKNVSRTNLLAIASGLHEIDAAVWARLGASAPH